MDDSKTFSDFLSHVKSKNKVDWHQVRIQASIAAMQGICTNNEAFVNMNNGLIVRNAIEIADALVKELKGE